MTWICPGPGYQRLRSGRRSESGRTYFLTTVAHERKPLFAEWPAASLMSRLVASPSRWPGAELLCWVLMPDHWHGLLCLGEGIDLSRVMRHAKGSTAREFNRLTARSGTVWRDGYHDRALREDEDLRTTARYLIANPLRAKLVASIGDYPYWDSVWLAADADMPWQGLG